MDCRICTLREPHVHASDTRVELAHIPPEQDFSFKPNRITGVDFALPAVKQDGKWWTCTQELVDMVWPRWKEKIIERRRRHAEEIRLGLRPPEYENEADQENR